jgi:hypothetical protein
VDDENDDISFNRVGTDFLLSWSQEVQHLHLCLSFLAVLNENDCYTLNDEMVEAIRVFNHSEP